MGSPWRLDRHVANVVELERQPRCEVVVLDAAAAVERELRPKTAIGAPDLRSKAEGIDVTAKRSI